MFYRHLLSLFILKYKIVLNHLPNTILISIYNTFHTVKPNCYDVCLSVANIEKAIDHIESASKPCVTQ